MPPTYFVPYQPRYNEGRFVEATSNYLSNNSAGLTTDISSLPTISTTDQTTTYNIMPGVGTGVKIYNGTLSTIARTLSEEGAVIIRYGVGVPVSIVIGTATERMGSQSGQRS